jgi:hypothetical protein
MPNRQKIQNDLIRHQDFIFSKPEEVASGASVPLDKAQSAKSQRSLSGFSDSELEKILEYMKTKDRK